MNVKKVIKIKEMIEAHGKLKIAKRSFLLLIINSLSAGVVCRG